MGLVAEGERALVPLPGRGARLAPADMVVRATRLALGAAGLALTVLEVLLERSGHADPGVRAGAAGAATPSGPPGTLRLLPVAALGLGLEAQRRSLGAASALGARVPPPVRVVARPAVAAARAPLVAVWRRLDLDGWAARGLAEQRRNRQAAAATARHLVGAIAAAVLDEVDVDAVVARVDLAGLTEQVMDEVDLGEIIRESSGTMATETVDALRVQGMRADHLLSRVVDRVLLRKDERDAAGP